MHGFPSGGPLQVFLSVLAFGLLKTLSQMSTRRHVAQYKGWHVLKYNIVTQAIGIILIVFMSCLLAMLLWAIVFHFTDIAGSKRLLLGSIVLISFFTGFIFLPVYVLFGIRISFDGIGIYRRALNGQETLLPWSQMTYFRDGDQVQIFGRDARKIQVSRYRNGRDFLAIETAAMT